MYAERTTTKLSPTGLVAAIGINGALIVALLHSNPEWTKSVDPPIEGYNVPITPPPPKPKPEPLPKAREKPSPQPPRSLPDAPKTEVELPPRTDVITGTADSGPLPRAEDAIGTGTGATVPLDPPKPLPVLVAAAPDARAEFQPPYPPELRRAEVEGRIKVRVLIGVDGRVKAVEPVGAGEPAFFEATRRHALARWRFKPATRDGEPYESWKVMAVRFELQG